MRPMNPESFSVNVNDETVDTVNDESVDTNSLDTDSSPEIPPYIWIILAIVIIAVSYYSSQRNRRRRW